MTINAIAIEELRMLAQDFKLAGQPMLLQTTQMIELLDRLEAAENAWKISDKTVYDLTEKVIPNIQEKLEAAENELVEIRHGAAVANDTIKALRAKIAEMEKQEPIGTALLCTRCSTPFDGDHYCPACGFHTAMEEHVYALPGAKGEEK